MKHNKQPIPQTDAPNRLAAKTVFNINTDIFEGEKAINAMTILGAELADDKQKGKLSEINSFIQNVWSQMCNQQFPNGINENTEVTKQTDAPIQQGYTPDELRNALFVDNGDFLRTNDISDIYIRTLINNEQFDICNFGCNETDKANAYAARIVECWNEHDGLKEQNKNLAWGVKNLAIDNKDLKAENEKLKADKKELFEAGVTLFGVATLLFAKCSDKEARNMFVKYQPKMLELFEKHSNKHK